MPYRIKSSLYPLHQHYGFFQKAPREAQEQNILLNALCRSALSHTPLPEEVLELTKDGPERITEAFFEVTGVSWEDYLRWLKKLSSI